MNRILYALFPAIAVLTSYPASADVLGDEDDQYIGLQLTMSLDRHQNRLSTNRLEYSTLIVNQQDGLREGIAFTRNFDGTSTLGYLTPSYEFEIGHGSISNHIVPLQQYDENGVPYNNLTGVAVVVPILVGAAVLFKLVDDASDEIVDCLTGEDCDDGEDLEPDEVPEFLL